MRVLCVTGMYPPDIGGAEISLHSALAEMAKLGDEIVVVTDDRHPARCMESVTVLTTAPHGLTSYLDGVSRQLDPEVLVTQTVFAKEAIAWARKQLCIPSVLMMRAAEDGSFMDCDEGPRCDLVIANSNSIRARASRWAVPVETVLPVVRRPSVPQGHLRSKVTMVNPVHVKGADRFAAIASACPEREFLAVRSWSGLRSGDSWSSDMWGRLAVSQGLDSLDAPAEFDFGNISNVEVIGPVADMGEHVYSRTRVLLVPSRWSEAFGRVVLEAQMCGIPVIAADVGGIRDALNGAGIVIACPDSIGTWVRALESLDDASAYRAARQRALTAASSYDCVNQVIKLRRLLAELLNSQRGVC